MKTKAGSIHPLGAGRAERGINFAFVSKFKDCGIILYNMEGTEVLHKIPFPAEFTVGSIHTVCVEGIKEKEFLYEFYENGKTVTDRHARRFYGNREYGSIEKLAGKKAWYCDRPYDWEQDKSPRIPYENASIYCLHVRGFTRHPSSKVKARGTFKGIQEKIPYLKELGITTLELQPAYEYDEKSYIQAADQNGCFLKPEEGEKISPLNYWGYTQGYYYSPKNSFSYGEDTSAEFKDLVKELHKNDMELVMQFYFPHEVTEKEISDILQFWVTEYHIDGIHLKGERTPVPLICEDPCFSGTKIWYYDFPAEGMKFTGGYRNFGIYRDDFRNDMRRFLKGDEGMVSAVLGYMRANPSHAGRINYFTNYDGFTLTDMVSYEKKHNEENGENNKDGNDYNFTWNCGVEGKSRRKSVMALRIKQIKNALCLLYLSQGTPLLFMGDEFGHTQNGNNNPYCQDNEITWLNWKQQGSGQEIYEFVKMLAGLRKSHPILHKEDELKLMDYISCGYPDLSYHGEAPWRPELEYHSRQVGIMLCGKYARPDRMREDDFFYIGINMHWEEHSFALPKLPKGLDWDILFGTDNAESLKITEEMTGAALPPRSIFVFISK